MKSKPEPAIDLTPDLFSGPARSKYLRRVWAQSRNRAKKSDIPFTILPDDVERLFRDQRGRCGVTDIAFHFERFPDAFVKHPFAPSIDRRLSSGGYTEDNVRLVCVAVNFGMGQWGEEMYLTLARAAVDHEAQVTARPDTTDTDWHTRQRERIAAAETLRDVMPDKAKQGRHIASLRRALSLGPEGLSEAARKARQNRKSPIR